MLWEFVRRNVTSLSRVKIGIFCPLLLRTPLDLRTVSETPFRYWTLHESYGVDRSNCGEMSLRVLSSVFVNEGFSHKTRIYCFPLQVAKSFAEINLKRCLHFERPSPLPQHTSRTVSRRRLFRGLLGPWFTDVCGPTFVRRRVHARVLSRRLGRAFCRESPPARPQVDVRSPTRVLLSGTGVPRPGSPSPETLTSLGPPDSFDPGVSGHWNTVKNH